MAMEGLVAVEPGDIVKAIEMLCIPRGSAQDDGSTKEPEVSALPPNAYQQFIDQLHNNLSRLDQFISESKPIQAALNHPHAALDHFHLQTADADVSWRFVVTALHLLRTLKVIIKTSVEGYVVREREEFAAMNPKQVAKAQMDSSAPRMSPDTLTPDQHKVLLSCLQMVVCLGLLPSLHPGVGVPIGLRSSFSSILQTQRIPDDAGDSTLAIHRDFRLVFCTKHLLELIQEPVLAGLILSKHLGDLLAALCQIVFAPRTKQLKALIKAHEEAVAVRLEGVKIEDENSENRDQERHKVGGVHITASIGAELDVEVDSLARRDGATACDVCTSELFKPYVAPQYTDVVRESPKELPVPLPIAALQEDEAYCNEQLGELMTRLQQPTLVRELALLQGVGGGGPPGQGMGGGAPRAPAWLRRASVRLLSEIIIKPNGVQSVLRGILKNPQEVSCHLDFKASDAVDWQKCEALSGTIAQVPRTQTPDQYYSSVGPQVLALLRCLDKVTERQFQQVAVSTIFAMASQQPSVALKHVIDPLLQPLLDCLSDKVIARTEGAVVLVDECRLSQCIEDIHRVAVVSGCALPPLLQTALHAILQPVFCLLCLACTTAVNLRTHADEILVTSLRNADHQVTLRTLHQFAFSDVTSEEGRDARRLHHDVMFAPGPSGGAVVVIKPGKGEFILPAAEDWEVRCACVVELVKRLNQDNVTADFFLSLLDRLTKVISDRMDSQDSKDTAVSDERDILLEIELRAMHQEAEASRSLVILHLVALLAEDVGPAFLTNPAHILQFAKITLERALQVLKSTDDEMMGVFECETVTMAMGMLTALMGGAAELSRQDKDSMQVVLPLLEELADHHPDPQVSEMAADLRIAVATRGAVWSELLRDAQRRDREKEKLQEVPEPEIMTLNLPDNVPAPLVGETSGGGGGRTKHRSREDAAAQKRHGPLIEVISSMETSPEVDLKQELEVEQQKCSGGKSTAGASGSMAAGAGGGGEAARGDIRVQTEGVRKQTVPQEVVVTTATSDFREAVDELCSPLVPVRGHALITLRRLVEQRDAETLERPDFLLKIFRENLDHADSYLYLAAVAGLAALADWKPDAILPALAAEYANQDAEGATTRRRSPEVRLKLGEVIVKMSRALGPLVPQYRDVLLAALLTGARDPDSLVRASAVSNMGELCKLLRYALGNVIHEVLECVTALVRHDPEPEVRKAAALHTTLLLQGVGKDAPKVLETTLRDVYRTLKLVLVSEKDPGVLLHVRLSLDELDTTMRALLFPPQTFTKRVRVLDPE